MKKREEMIVEILALVKDHPLSSLTAEIFDHHDDHRVHGALMMLRGHQESGRLLLAEIMEPTSLVRSHAEIADFTHEEVVKAIQAWRG